LDRHLDEPSAQDYGGLGAGQFTKTGGTTPVMLGASAPSKRGDPFGFLLVVHKAETLVEGPWSNASLKVGNKPTALT